MKISFLFQWFRYIDPNTKKSLLRISFLVSVIMMISNVQKCKSSDFFSWNTIKCDLLGVKRDWKRLRWFIRNIIVSNTCWSFARERLHIPMQTSAFQIYRKKYVERTGWLVLFQYYSVLKATCWRETRLFLYLSRDFCIDESATNVL